MKNRIITGLISVQLSLCTLSTLIPFVSAAENIINIKSADDFIKFSKNCTLDTWSQEKIVNLNDDIDFSGYNFVPVSTFGGTFNGNGYTLSGITSEIKGSYQGIFRYVQQGGKISNLNVSGKFISGGSKSFIGGIAGENSGTIEKCSFNGSIKGENVIGGITGHNNEYGQIVSCTSSGSISGENSTGGIAGKNSGFIRSSTNNMAVNTIYEEKKNNISDIDTDTGSILENYKKNEEENEEESILGHSDTGGIAGYSSGIIQGCINNAAIGYKHIGYNVGGITGRQCGYILGCQNYGLIYGRKDTGGIVGQAEPYILLHTSESALKDIKQELNNLNTIVNNFINDAGNLTDDAKKHLDKISENAKNAQKDTNSILDQGVDFIDDNLGEINAQTAILSNTVDKFIPVFENIEDLNKDLTNSIDSITSAIDDIKIYSPDLTSDIDDITNAMSEISRAEKSIEKAFTRADKARYFLDGAIEFNNITQVRNSLSELSSSISDIAQGKQDVQTSIKKIEDILTSKPENFESIGINAKQIAENLKNIRENTGTVITSFKNISNNLDNIVLNSEINFSDFQTAAKYAEYAIEYLGDTMHYLTTGLQDLGNGIKSFSGSLEDYTDDISSDLNTAKNNLSDSITTLSYATDDIEASVRDIKNILSDLSEEDSLEFIKLGDDFKNSGENLFDSLSGISREIDFLKNTISEEKNKLTYDLTSMSNQFNLIMNLLVGEIEELKTGTRSLENIFLDVSDEDIENTKQGKIADCHNFGIVEADRNTGGIAGAMAIEYSMDPEDDIEKPDTINFTYRTKAILQSCVNEGKITGKKDCTGGITGLAEIGTVYKCENYGNTESSNGNYVGGIAGKSTSSIRKCYSKSILTGKRYIGGIAGKSDIIISSYSIVNVNGDENTGAICGYSEKNNNLYGNFYVDNGIGAIDGISYSGKAESISFEKLTNISDIPKRFISFTVTFLADDKIIDKQDIKYGENTSRIKFPEIPSKDGYFGRWQKPGSETVTENIEIVCEYMPYITILASNEKNENGKLALALAEGNFTDIAELHIKSVDTLPPINSDKNVNVYEISLNNTNIKADDNVNIRLLNENKSKISAWLLNDGNWEKLKTEKKGKYIRLQTKGTNSTICLRYETKTSNIIWIIPLIIILILIPSFILVKRKYLTIKQIP